MPCAGENRPDATQMGGITAAFNEDKPNDASVSFNDEYFGASSVQKMTTK